MSSYAARSDTRASVREPPARMRNVGTKSTTSATCEEVVVARRPLRARPWEALRDQRRQRVDRLVQHGHAHEAAQRCGRDSSIDRARDALLRIDVRKSRRLPSNHAPLRGAELPRVAGALEGRAHDQVLTVGRQVEIEARTQRLVAEAELHHLRLEHDAPALQERQEVAHVFAAHVDADTPRPLRLEASQHADRFAIPGRGLILRLQEQALGKSGMRCTGSSIVTVQHAADAPLRLHAVLERFRRGGQRFGKPSVDTFDVIGPGTRVAAAVAAAIRCGPRLGALASPADFDARREARRDFSECAATPAPFEFPCRWLFEPCPWRVSTPCVVVVRAVPVVVVVRAVAAFATSRRANRRGRTAAAVPMPVLLARARGRAGPR